MNNTTEPIRRSTKEGHAPFPPAVINAIARALGRLELVNDWAGADHDAPGTTQDEREASRWAAKQFLQELEQELSPLHSVADYNNSSIHIGPFQPLAVTTPQEERSERWANPDREELNMMSETYADYRKAEAYDTHAWDLQGVVMSDAEVADYHNTSEGEWSTI